MLLLKTGAAKCDKKQAEALKEMVDTNCCDEMSCGEKTVL
jgi:hypothetical protein